jgi:crotonobetainyl-CoA:carnitine CoA-transferase CaiB-like acyl-CoA transferase
MCREMASINDFQSAETSKDWLCYLWPMFKDLKVVELASVLAGPAVGMFFSELGAQVIKVENSRSEGDVTRSWKLPSESKDSNVSAYFSSVNWGKMHLFKDLADPTDNAEVVALITDADVLIVNFKHGDDLKFGFGHKAMRKLNPQLIYARLTGFESTPERGAYDVVLQAEAGYMHMNGDADGNPTKMPLAMIDILAAHQLKQGILVGLLQRASTGEGCVVESSLERSAIASLCNQAGNWLMGNHIPQRMGSLHPNIAPYGEIFTCSDEKQIVLAVGSDKQFSKLCAIIDAPELATDSRFVSNQERVIHRVEMHACLSPLLANFKRDELLTELTEAVVPAGGIHNMQEVFEGPVAKTMILEEEMDGHATKRVASVGFKISKG